MKIRPIGDRILIKRTEEEETKKGGIIIPDTAKEKPQKGVVIAVGKKVNDKGETLEFQVKPKDKILFSKYAGTEVKLEDDDMLLVREEDILAVLE